MGKLKTNLASQNTPTTKIFMWLLLEIVIITKINLKRCKWKGNEICAFCTEKETADHLFVGCMTANYVWSLIGRVCDILKSDM